MGAEIPDGAVLVARAITNSSLWTMRAADRILAITCICMANWKPRKWFDGDCSVEIKRGEFVTSREHLAEAAKLSEQTVRTSLKNLEKVGFLTRKSTSRWTLVSLPKYDHYQTMSKYYPTKDLTNDQPAVNQPLTNDQPAPNHKQELYKGDEGKEWEELTKVSAGNNSVESHIISAWNRSPGFPISHQQGQKLVRAYIDSGVSAERQLEAVSNQPACKGKKFWEVIEPLRPAQDVPGVQSMADIIKNVRLG